MRFLALAFSLVATSAFACPKLSGSYSYCHSTTGGASEMKDLVITQTIKNKITTYTFNFNEPESNDPQEHEYIADGKTRQVMQDDDEDIKVMGTNSCSGQTLITKQLVSMYNQKIAEIKQNIQMKDGKIEIVVSGEMAGSAFSDLIVCE